jgi:Arc/MetJ-type ribon-helix-helix transcriptional regulator
MKKRISATVDDKTIKKIKELLKKGKYRNKSHVIEEAIKQLK